MSSVIPGYHYDIFISYRHNDNRSGWVTSFVNSLKAELQTISKDSVSIYFDAHPVDGLLEMHDVEDSLNEKLHAYIFMPIISQTYCDVKSYAWRNEFLAFNKLAAQDPTGLKVKLPNGNVTSRILPIRIHEIDDADAKLLESEIGRLRSIDFIFRSAGVNRPLQAIEDRPQENLNKTYYRDQINKVAHTIKHMLVPVNTTPSREPRQLPSSSVSNTQIIIGVALGLLFAVAFFIFYFLR